MVAFSIRRETTSRSRELPEAKGKVKGGRGGVFVSELGLPITLLRRGGKA